MTLRVRLLASAILAAVLFTAGYLLGAIAPGGGDAADQDFTDFYNSDGKILAAVILAIVLTLGCLATLWFFTELWERLPDDVLNRLGRSATTMGLVGVAAGGLILMAPAGVQLNTDRDFVGIDIANTFAQAGFAVMLILGLFSLALAVCLASVAIWRTNAAPRWFAIFGIVAAVIMLGSYIWIPGFIFPVWVLAAGIIGLREEAPR